MKAICHDPVMADFLLFGKICKLASDSSSNILKLANNQKFGYPKVGKLSPLKFSVFNSKLSFLATDFDQAGLKIY